MTACYNGYISIAQFFLQKGANVNKATPSVSVESEWMDGWMDGWMDEWNDISRM